MPSNPRTMSMLNTHARYFDEMSTILGGEFPKVHYLGSRAFDQFLWEARHLIAENGQPYYGSDDTFYFRGVRIIRTGEA